MKRLLILFAAIGLLVTATTTALATPPRSPHKVTICHATPPDTAAQGYVSITIDVAGTSGIHKLQAHANQHDADIIPSFSYDTFSYAGKNWDAEGQAILENGCKTPDATPTPTPTGGQPTPTPTPTDSPSSTPTPTPIPTDDTPTPTPVTTLPSAVTNVTPPPTDTIEISPSSGTTAIPALAGLVGLLALALFVVKPFRSRARK